MKKNIVSRRGFLKTGTLAALVGVAGGSAKALAAAGEKPLPAYTPNSGRKLRVAAIGSGGRAHSNITGLYAAGAEIVALCDVDFERAQNTYVIFPSVPRFVDYREMLDVMGDQIDAVVISTPDHMHYPAATLAISKGKHVYVEKPATHTVEEARLLAIQAKKAGVMTIMGNQGHANEGTRLCKEWIEAGVIGAVHEVHCWTNRPIWPQGMQWPAKAPVPETLKWDLWQGVAPLREYGEDIAPFKWRGFWDYGCGALGDMACHIMDAPFWALNMRGDVKLSSKVDAYPNGAVTAPTGATVTYEFPARGNLPPLKMVWFEGKHLPPKPAELGDQPVSPGGGMFIFGEKGTIMDTSSYCSSPRLIPAEKMAAFKDRPERTIPRVPGGNQYLEFINACLGKGPKPGSNLEDHANDLTELVLLGVVAMRYGKDLSWDSKKMSFGVPEADKLVRKQYREF